MKTVQEINEKIKASKALVLTAEEIIDVVRQKGLKRAAEEVDVVTTGTFGPMCSSGAYFNTGHAKPRIKFGGGNAYLNDVPLISLWDPRPFLTRIPGMRFSPGREKTQGEFDHTVAVLGETIRHIRSIASADGDEKKRKMGLPSFLEAS